MLPAQHDAFGSNISRYRRTFTLDILYAFVPGLLHAELLEYPSTEFALALRISSGKDFMAEKLGSSGQTTTL